jgi:hypothetical protein
LELFTNVEKEQFEKNRSSLQTRIEQIPIEIEQETQAIKQRFANPNPRLFPLAIVYNEKNRDRSIQRTIKVFEAPSEIDPQWRGINCVIKVFRQGIRGKQFYQSKLPTYYICSLAPH